MWRMLCSAGQAAALQGAAVWRPCRVAANVLLDFSDSQIVQVGQPGPVSRWEHDALMR
jgi:hypothetical protein